MAARQKVEFDQGVLLQGDCLKVLASLPEKSVDLVFGSPPYEAQRLYKEDGKDLGIARDTEEWVAWMVEVFKACLRVSKGLVALVVGHGVGARNWSCGPMLLAADLKRAGVILRRPVIYYRDGIMGSGTTDWLKANHEHIICATNDAGELPWSDNTACGAPPKWRPGGEVSHRTREGERVNNRKGKKGGRDASRKPDAAGSRLKEGRITMRGTGNGEADGNRDEQYYIPPDIANPGDVIRCDVGGGRISDTWLAHDNEAPFPEKLAEFFVRSFCPPEGTTLDPFMGGGATAAVCVKNNRRFIGIDLRPSQVELAIKRVQVALRNIPLI